MESLNDRMVDAMNAADAFVDKTTGQDRVGLVSFGSRRHRRDGIAILYNTSGNRVPNTTYWNDMDPNGWRAGNDFSCMVGGPAGITQLPG